MLPNNNRISIDDLDLRILFLLQNLKEGEQITTYDLVKKIFDMNELNNTERIKKNNFLKKRLNKLNSYGIIVVTKDNSLNKHYFDLIAENVEIRKMRIKKMNIDCNAMFLNINERWNVFIRDFFVV